MAGNVLDVRDLTVALPAGADRANAVENISFAVKPGEIVENRVEFTPRGETNIAVDNELRRARCPRLGEPRL